MQENQPSARLAIQAIYRNINFTKSSRAYQRVHPPPYFASKFTLTSTHLAQVLQIRQLSLGIIMAYTQVLKNMGRPGYEASLY